jgi:hypothetical protein
MHNNISRIVLFKRKKHLSDQEIGENIVKRACTVSVEAAKERGQGVYGDLRRQRSDQALGVRKSASMARDKSSSNINL